MILVFRVADGTSHMSHGALYNLRGNQFFHASQPPLQSHLAWALSKSTKRQREGTLGLSLPLSETRAEAHRRLFVLGLFVSCSGASCRTVTERHPGRLLLRRET